MFKPKKISKHFYNHEVLPPQICNNYGDNSIWFIDEGLMDLADFIRDHFDAPMNINNWYWNGKFSERGYRVPDSKTGASKSQHKLGKALDFTIKGISPNRVRVEILKNEKLFLSKGLTVLEHPDFAPTWVHMDTRWTNLNFILIVKPAAIQTLDGQDVMPEYYRFIDNELVPLSNFPLK